MDKVSGGSFDLRGVLRLLFRRRRLILLVLFLCVGSALAVSYLQTPVYEGEVRLLIDRRDSESPFESVPRAQPEAARTIRTEMEVIKSPPVQALVRERLGRVGSVSVTPVSEADIIKIKGRSTDRRLAADTAIAYAETYIEYRRAQAVDDTKLATQRIQGKVAELEREIRAIEAEIATASQSQRATALRGTLDNLVSQQSVFKRRLDELQVEAELKSGGADLIATTPVPTTQVAPRPLRSGAIALALGAVLGTGLALLFESLDHSVRNKEELGQVAPGLPVLGLIPLTKRRRGRSNADVPTLGDPESLTSECFRSLRTALQFIGTERSPKIFQITSPNAGEGKTWTVSNLAVALARSGQKVLIVDCDLRRPRLHEYFGVSKECGFTSVFLGQVSPHAALQMAPDVPNLAILASGPVPPNASELLSDRRTGEIFAALQEDFDVALVDSPPVLPVADPVALSVWVEATLLVVAAGRTQREGLQRTIEVLRQGEAPLVGIVLNEVQHQDVYSRYTYGRGENGQRPGRRSQRSPDPKGALPGSR